VYEEGKRKEKKLKDSPQKSSYQWTLEREMSMNSNKDQVRAIKSQYIHKRLPTFIY
jgi:hypothetical protein